VAKWLVEKGADVNRAEAVGTMALQYACWRGEFEVAKLLVEKGAAYVFTVVDGTARRTPVTTGISDGIVVEILDGLDGSESVVLAGRGLVTDGMRVIVGGQG
jgi:hypothetical protein